MNPSLPEKQLINQVIQGDHAAFSLLMEKYQQKVFQTAMGFMHNRADAEDLTQEVFIKVYHALKLFRGESSFSTWIYRITVNQAIKQIRKNKIRAMVGLNKQPENEPTDETHADDRILKKEQKREITNAVNQLNRLQKAAFVLFYYQDLSIVDVADILKKSPKATESLIFRARQNLQKSLKKNPIR